MFYNILNILLCSLLLNNPNSYNKKIFTNNKLFQVINKNHSKKITSFSYNFLHVDKYFKIYNNKIQNNIDFFLFKKTKIFIHLEQLIPKTNIYHIGITFKDLFTEIRYDVRWIDIGFLNLKKTKSITLFWDYSNYTIDDIVAYEKQIEFDYILGIYDCRHYVRNLTYWACSNPTPVWKLYKLL